MGRYIFLQVRNHCRHQDGGTDLHTLKLLRQEIALGSFSKNLEQLTEPALEEREIAMPVCLNDIHVQQSPMDLVLLMDLDSLRPDFGIKPTLGPEGDVVMTHAGN